MIADDSTKHLHIVLHPDTPQSTTKRAKLVKEKRTRVEALTWELSETQLSHATQLAAIQQLSLNVDGPLANGSSDTGPLANVSSDTEPLASTPLVEENNSRLKTHIKTKLSGYKHQDVLKHKLCLDSFISFSDTVALLNESALICCYCSDPVFILYEKALEQKQWSLDRINNDLGHNKGNVVIACLQCNLKRRRTNKHAFMFTKQMTIVKGV